MRNEQIIIETCIKIDQILNKIPCKIRSNNYEISSCIDNELTDLIELFSIIQPLVLDKLKKGEIDECYVSHRCYIACKLFIETFLLIPANSSPDEVRDAFFEKKEYYDEYLFKFIIYGIDLYYD